MAKGLAVISGSNSVVFKALENGNIVLGQDIAASVVVSGSLKLNIGGEGADKFLISDADGNASWVTIQASQVATSDGSNVQAKLDAISSGQTSGLGSLETRLSSEEVRAASAESSLDSRISTEVANLVAGAPALLDTLDELAAALGDDENFAVTISNQIASVTTSVSAEASVRASADASLQSRISSEEVNRATADSSLEGRISSDASARDAADGSLETIISNEEDARASAVVSVDSRRSAEESARASGDAAEAAARSAADSSLEGRLSSEESARAAGDASLASDLSAETSRAESVEASLAAALSEGNDGSLSAAKSYTDSKVADLVDGAPELLDTLNELAAAIGDDPNYAATIATQMGSMTTRISTEEAARAAADSSLEGRLSSEESARDAADSSLETRVSSEEVARADADSSLTSRISSEEVARAAADTSLEGRLSSEESARASAIDDLADNTITIQGTANEVEVVSGGTITLGDSSSTVVLGLPDDVVVSSSLNVTGDTTLGVGPIDDQLTINSKMRITLVNRTAHANVLADYADTAALAAGDFDGHMFYLQGDDASSGMFQQGNKWYFCEHGVWHSSFFYVGS